MATSISLSGTQRNITADQGSTIKVDFSLTTVGGIPLDLSGYTLRLQVRKSFDSADTLINCTLANGKLIWVSQIGGAFKLHIAAAETSAIRFSKDSPELLEGYYDLEIEDALGDVSKPVKGSFILNREVTR